MVNTINMYNVICLKDGIHYKHDNVTDSRSACVWFKNISLALVPCIINTQTLNEKFKENNHYA